MIRKCCVCKKVHLKGQWVKLKGGDIEREAVTHTFCPECEEAQREEAGLRWGPAFKAARQERGVSQHVAAIKCGVTAMTISRWERGLFVPSRAVRIGALTLLREIEKKT